MTTFAAATPTVTPGAVEALQRLQNDSLEALAHGDSLQRVATRICLAAEALAPEAICSILTVADGMLHPLAGPGLPDAYSRAIDGVRIGPQVGSCGTGAYTGMAVESDDIEHDPLWNEWRALALRHDLRACWSSPIKARDGRVVGTFAFYYRSTRGPADLERLVVEKCVHLCAVAIEHAEVQARIQRLAYHDSLTGLPNRASFQEHAAGMLVATTEPRTVDMLCIDLDDFKAVNDTLGHETGDLLLQAVANRLRACMAGDAFVARVGGDEFAVVQSGSAARGASVALAEKIIAALDEPFDIDEQKVIIGASIGIADGESGGCALGELFRRADMALYCAKNEGRRTYRFFTADMEARAQARRSFRHDLRAAIAAFDFSLVYQPIVALDTQAIGAVEALLRWRHPVRGNVRPAEFIPMIEELGLIGAVGERVLRDACSVAATWPLPIRIAVNLSALQLKKPRLMLDVLSALRDSGLAPSRLDLEITESALLAENAATRTALRELREIGVGISLDDFGTGYSSLRSLRAFPFDKIKIDMSFVHDIDRNAESTAIIRSVIHLARDLGMRTVAEGIETQAQVDWLTAQGCDEGQGHYFSEAVTGAELDPLFAQTAHGRRTTHPATGAPVHS